MLASNDKGYGIPSSQLSEPNIESALYVSHMKPFRDIVLMVALQYFYQVQIYYKLTINLTKASIVLLYYRIFTTRPFRACCLALLTVILIFGASLTATTIFQCTPIHKKYIQSTPGQCLSHLTLWRVNALYNILSDIVIIGMPFPVLRSLSLPTGQFAGLAVILCCGIFVILTAILRYTTLSTSGHADDPVAGTLPSTLWTEAEACVAIICACLPMMRVLLQRWLPFLRNYSSRSTRSGNGVDPADHNQLHNYQASELRNYEHLDDTERGRDGHAPYPVVPRIPSQRYSSYNLPMAIGGDLKIDDVNRTGHGEVHEVMVYTRGGS